MTRRILMLLGSFAVLASAFGVYWLATRDEWDSAAPKAQMPDLAAAGPSKGPAKGPAALARLGEGLMYTDRDKQGRLAGIYEADRWDRQDDGTYVVAKPRITLHHRDGRQIYLRADSGRIHVEEVGGKYSFPRGRLSGGVLLAYDLSTEPQRTPLRQMYKDYAANTAGQAHWRPPGVSPERLDQIVQIELNDVSFDNSLLEMSTPNRVAVRSAHMDFAGENLSIFWNESPQELRRLRVERGQYMIVRNMSRSLSLTISRPQEGSAEQAPPQQQPLTSQAVVKVPSLQSVLGSFKPPGAATTSQAAEPFNVYLARFDQQVTVETAEGLMTGAEKLSLLFELDARQGRQGARQAGPASQDGPTSQPGESPVTQPMVINWSGPLEINPVGRVDAPSLRRFIVAAEGKDLRLKDAQGTAAECGDFIFLADRQQGRLGAGQAGQVRLTTSDGSEMTCRSVMMDRPAGLVSMDGPGRMSGKSLGLGADAAASPAASAGDSISWSQLALVKFQQVRGAAAQGKPQTPEASSTRIREALFLGKVQMIQGQGGDSAVCDRSLHVQMDDSSDRLRLARAVAEGNVQAASADGEISAQRVILEFNEGKPARRVAEGDVVVRQRGGEAGKQLEASAERVEGDAARQSWVLKGAAGKPAQIVRAGQDGDLLSGQEIRIYGQPQTPQSPGTDESMTLVIPGAGNLRYVVTEDLDGKAVPPRPLTIAWTGGMRFSGKDRTAHFAGDVNLLSGADSLRGRKMDVAFKPKERPVQTQPAQAVSPLAKAVEAAAPRVPQQPPVAAASAADAGRANLKIDMQDFRNLTISSVKVQEKVRLQSIRQDAENKLTRRLTLDASDLLFEPQAGRMTVNGKGWLLAEDYDPPQPNASGQAQSPSQTTFEWAESMTLLQSDRTATLKGAVWMGHASGRFVVPPKDVPVPDWGELRGGRDTQLRCEELFARFAERTSAKTAGDDFGVGELDEFRAIERVRLVDGKTDMQGQRLIFGRIQDKTQQKKQSLAVVYGYLQGQPKSKAVVKYEDVAARRPLIVASPEISCIVSAEGQILHVETDRAAASGGR